MTNWHWGNTNMDNLKKQNLQLLVERFDEYLASLNYAAKTRVGYKHQVEVFINWIVENTTIETVSQITPSHLQQYQVALSLGNQLVGQIEPKRLSISLQITYIIAVRSFFRYLVRGQQLIYNPADNLQLPKRPQTLAKMILTKTEVRKLLSVYKNSDDIKDIRDQAILEIFYCTGIRKSELLGLTLSDISLVDRIITVKAKGGHSRIIPLNETATYALSRYLEVSRSQLIRDKQHSYLFVCRRFSTPLGSSDLEDIVNRATKKAKLKRRVTPHMLRHSCATHLLENQADIRQIQQLLGHRYLSSTEIYTQVSVTDLRQMISRCHPRERKQ